jgi:SEC-C motif-containing protein
MRARYSAYVKDRIDFVERTSDPRHRDSFDREASEAWARESEWLGLEVVATREGQEGDASGEVEFKARYRRNGEELTHHEVSLFTHFPAGGGWNYTDGREIREPIRNAMKTGRNDPCPCGSGKKFKKCCG